MKRMTSITSYLTTPSVVEALPVLTLVLCLYLWIFSSKEGEHVFIKRFASFVIIIIISYHIISLLLLQLLSPLLLPLLLPLQLPLLSSLLLLLLSPQEQQQLVY